MVEVGDAWGLYCGDELMACLVVTEVDGDWVLAHLIEEDAYEEVAELFEGKVASGAGLEGLTLRHQGDELESFELIVEGDRARWRAT